MPSRPLQLSFVVMYTPTMFMCQSFEQGLAARTARAQPAQRASPSLSTRACACRGSLYRSACKRSNSVTLCQCFRGPGPASSPPAWDLSPHFQVWLSTMSKRMEMNFLEEAAPVLCIMQKYSTPNMRLPKSHTGSRRGRFSWEPSHCSCRGVVAQTWAKPPCQPR